jgi:type IV pilus assembly protein PilA
MRCLLFATDLLYGSPTGIDPEETMICLPMDGSDHSARPPEKCSKAFTMVELLVVMLILAILMAVALPLYLVAVSSSARRTARYNLHTLITAEEAYRLQSPSHAYTSNLHDLCPLNGPDPAMVLSSCPVGPGSANYVLYLGGQTLPPPDNRPVPTGGVAACAEDPLKDASKYGCFLPGEDSE